MISMGSKLFVTFDNFDRKRIMSMEPFETSRSIRAHLLKLANRAAGDTLIVGVSLF